MHLQFQGIVHIDQGGKKFQPREDGKCMCLSTNYLGKPPGELQPMIGHGVYENEYVKENGTWKIKKITLGYQQQFSLSLAGWLGSKETSEQPTETRDPYAPPDVTRDIGDRTWRSGYKVPCHFKNPVTGR